MKYYAELRQVGYGIMSDMDFIPSVAFVQINVLFWVLIVTNLEK